MTEQLTYEETRAALRVRYELEAKCRVCEGKAWQVDPHNLERWPCQACQGTGRRLPLSQSLVDMANQVLQSQHVTWPVLQAQLHHVDHQAAQSQWLEQWGPRITTPQATYPEDQLDQLAESYGVRREEPVHAVWECVPASVQNTNLANAQKPKLCQKEAINRLARPGQRRGSRKL